MIAGEFSQAAPISQTIFFRIDRRLQMADPALTDQWKETVRENIRNGAELNVAFLLMNVLAATIACYGLFANSPAVVIGAMIVAMLLGPIARGCLVFGRRRYQTAPAEPVHAARWYHWSDAYGVHHRFFAQRHSHHERNHG